MPCSCTIFHSLQTAVRQTAMRRQNQAEFVTRGWALFEIVDNTLVAIAAVRHQRESDCRR